MTEKKIELLAPAGSMDVMKACFSAGADAVYMGLSRFSARAYAKNAEEEEYEDAIRYAHLRGKKLYCTVNTLMKQEEIENDLYPLLEPLYEAGLDGVIVQDLGAVKMIRRCFPLLPVHISTQETVVGTEGVRKMLSLGAKRIVPARELSLAEIRKIYEETGAELECFIHGALCYSYSGQCLFSSIAGGRSGNRGRCAQPCRMPYETAGRKNLYAISLKDLNTLRILPDIIEAGVYSLKIEGRMKKAEYAAGVTAVYRKYLDLYLEKGKEGYTVDPADEKKLFDLFNRQGFTDGYYVRQNDKSMLTLKEAAFREENTEWNGFIRENYIEKEAVLKIRGEYSFEKGRLPYLTLSAGTDGKQFTVTAEGTQEIQEASSREASKEDIEKQLLKTGNTPFVFGDLRGKLGSGLFVPVSSVNELRRNAVSLLEDEICRSYERLLPEKDRNEEETKDASGKTSEEEMSKERFFLSAQVRTKKQLSEVLNAGSIETVYLESVISEADEYAMLVRKIREAGKKAYLCLPQIFRLRAENWFMKNLSLIRDAHFDGYLVRSLEGLGFVQKAALPGETVSDFTLYAFNTFSEETVSELGADRLTVPVELNRKEILNTGFAGQEIVLYGRLPMMVSANCLRRTTKGCDRTPGMQILKDRMGNEMQVINDCRYCLNTILNSLPLSLHDSLKEIEPMHLSSGRLIFTTEEREETRKVLELFSRTYGEGSEKETPSYSSTRGHFRRGVE